MRLTFTKRDNGPRNLLADCELEIQDPHMPSVKITGLAVWSGREGGVYVTFPSKKVGEKYYDYIRGVGGFEPIKSLKARIVEEYHDWSGNERGPEPDDSEIRF